MNPNSTALKIVKTDQPEQPGLNRDLSIAVRVLSKQDIRYRHWLHQAELYDSKGFINRPLLNLLTILAYLHLESSRRDFFSITKRGFDLVSSLLLIAASLPVLLACAVAVKLSSPGPVFFVQLRAGLFGKPFWMIKFRTMYAGADQVIKTGAPLDKPQVDNRSTTVGRFLRRRKLDELPQLFNVLFGDMSLVGPRPLPLEESASTRESHLLRFAVRPGITGLWQATKPNTIPGWRKIAYDCRYVKRRGWLLDLKILVLTFRVIIMGENRFKG